MTKNTKSFIYFLRLPAIFLVIAIVAGYLIFIANGYILNLKSKTIEQTGMIYLKSSPRGVNIYLNNELKGSKTPIKLGELTSGRYDIKVSQDTYQDWQKSLNVEKGFVNAEDSIVLFYKDPIDSLVTEEEKEAFKKLPNKLLNADIKIMELSEIWVPDPENSDKNILVTRLSQPIKKAVYYSDKKHIIFQVGSEIRVIDLDGSNNLKLVALPSEDSIEFHVDDSGQYLFYQVKDELKKIKIH